MIFVPDTAPLQELVNRKLGDGDSLTVVGIPRINLNAVFGFVSAGSGRPATRKLPYEIIVIALVK
jgi:hypothetical protein